MIHNLSFKTKQYVLGKSAGNRQYMVYISAYNQVGTVVPLVVMLHGCTQTAEDFAAGTQMNQLAEQYGFIVVYPQQTSKENRNRCWNWFTSSNQTPGRGEPARIPGVFHPLFFQPSHCTI